MDDKYLKKDLASLLLLVAFVIVALFILYFWDNHSQILTILSQKILK
jgi:hypothetical protein